MGGLKKSNGNHNPIWINVIKHIHVCCKEEFRSLCDFWSLFQSTKTDMKGGKSSTTPAPPAKPPSRGKTQGTLGDRELTRSPTGITVSPVAHEDPILDKKYKEKLYAQVREIIVVSQIYLQTSLLRLEVYILFTNYIPCNSTLNYTTVSLNCAIFIFDIKFTDDKLHSMQQYFELHNC